jgi:hypothetical protein
VFVADCFEFGAAGERGQSSTSDASIQPTRWAENGTIERLPHSDLAQQEPLGLPGLHDGRTRGRHEPTSVAAERLDLAVLGRAVDFRPRRAGFFGRPRPMLNASSRRCWA